MQFHTKRELFFVMGLCSSEKKRWHKRKWFYKEFRTKLNACFWCSKKSNSYRDIHNASKGKDKKCVKESEQVSLGGQGGEEEADEGDAADVGGGQGEQAEEQLHGSHSLSCLVRLLFFWYFVPALWWRLGTLGLPLTERLSGDVCSSETGHLIYQRERGDHGKLPLVTDASWYIYNRISFGKTIESENKLDNHCLTTERGDMEVFCLVDAPFVLLHKCTCCTWCTWSTCDKLIPDVFDVNMKMMKYLFVGPDSTNATDSPD